MDLNLNTLVGVTYLVPIAVTLRKVYAPSFEIPEAISMAVRKIDKARSEAREMSSSHAAARAA